MFLCVSQGVMVEVYAGAMGRSYNLQPAVCKRGAAAAAAATPRLSHTGGGGGPL